MENKDAEKYMKIIIMGLIFKYSTVIYTQKSLKWT